MKRTPLKRKTPLRPKPGARLAHASGKQAERLARYHAMVDGWKGERVCAKCGSWACLEPHHPFGRNGENLFRVILLCHTCHEGCHASPDLAYRLGYLQPEYRGVIRPPDFPTPWKTEHLITDIPT